LERMNNFTRDLLAVFGAHSNQTFAWCVLPNHYHALVEVPNIKVCCVNWDHFMVELHTLGIARREVAAARFSFALSNARCARSGITGRH
jgi:hypothetical protein